MAGPQYVFGEKMNGYLPLARRGLEDMGEEISRVCHFGNVCSSWREQTGQYQ